MAALMAGKGFAEGQSVLHEKVKFTVSVRGRQWSSARYVHETVEEFARVIQRNACRLEFIGENDRIQRLQLARADGSEPEELDVDATLEDVLICMGDKRLVAIIIPSMSPVVSSGRREVEKALPTTMAITSQSKSDIQNAGTVQPPNRYGLARSMPVLPVKEIPPEIPGLNTVPALRRVASRESPLRRLQITIPSPESNAPTFLEEKGTLAKDFNHEHEAVPTQPKSNRFNGAVVSKSNTPVALMSSKSTPSPAELAHFLVKGSSLPSHRSTTMSGTCNPFCSQYLGNATPVPGFHSFAAALLRRLPVIPPTSVVCGGTPTDNIASTLAQFLASHLRAVVPGNNRKASCPPDSGQHFPHNNIDSSNTAEDIPCSSELEGKHCSHTRDKPLEGSGRRPHCRHSSGNGFDEASGSASEQKDKKDPSSPPADTIVSPSNGCPVSETLHGRSELIFFVNRRSKTVRNYEPMKPDSETREIVKLIVVITSFKFLRSISTESKFACEVFCQKMVLRMNDYELFSTQSIIIKRMDSIPMTIQIPKGVGAHHLKLSDLSIYFHLSVVDAAKKLGVSQTTLKKACRKFGLKRWPGRKVRSLESTIHGLEHTIAVGQGTGMEQLTEAYIRSEVTKLQEEMNQLVHGTLAQSPATRSGDLYKKLYSRGWRSKYQSTSFNFDLNTDSQDNDERMSSSRGNIGCKGIEESGVAEPECNSRNSCSPPNCRWDQESNKVDKKGGDNAVSLDVGVGIEHCAIAAGGTNNVADSQLVEKLAKDDTNRGIVELLTDQDLFCERSLKRPKLGVN